MYILKNSINTDNKQNSSNIKEDSTNRAKRLLNFIYCSNNKLFRKDQTAEVEKGSNDSNLSSVKKEIILKLSSYTKSNHNVQFSGGVEEIEYDDAKNDKFLLNISNKRFNTPKRVKFTYKKTKEHIKTPYKTTKSHSSKNYTKKSIVKNRSNLSSKSSYYWKTLLDNDEVINDMNNSIDLELLNNNIDLNKSFTLENPYSEFFGINDDEEEHNKSF